MRVLVVEKGHRIAAILERMLSKKGYDVLTASQAKKALSIVSKQRPHVVVANLGSRGMRELKRIEGISADTAVVLVTRRGSIEIAKRAMREGAYDYITEPIEEDFADVVESAFLDRERVRKKSCRPA